MMPAKPFEPPTGPTHRVVTPALSADLRQQVDWKLFELAALLIGGEATREDLREAQAWFQQKHATEVVEERVCAGDCGWVLCPHKLVRPKKAARVVRIAPSDGQKGTYGITKYDERGAREAEARDAAAGTNVDHSPRYRIDAAGKRVYEIGGSVQYCSTECLTLSESWIRQLDTSAPYTRTVATDLLRKSEKKSKASMADILDVLEAAEGRSATATRTGAESEVPRYNHPQVTVNGVVDVSFRRGEPVTKKDAPNPVGIVDKNETAKVPRTATKVAAAAAAGVAQEEDKPKEDVTPSTINKTTQPKQETRTIMPKGAELEGLPDLDSIMSTMRNLQLKHNFKPKPPKTETSPPPPAGPTEPDVTNAPPPVEEKVPPAESAIACGHRPGVKVVTFDVAEDRKEAVVESVATKTKKAPQPAKPTKPSKPQSLLASVQERPSAAPMSANAILTKREPPPSSFGSSMFFYGTDYCGGKPDSDRPAPALIAADGRPLVLDDALLAGGDGVKVLSPDEAAAVGVCVPTAATASLAAGLTQTYSASSGATGSNRWDGSRVVRPSAVVNSPDSSVPHTPTPQ